MRTKDGNRQSRHLSSRDPADVRRLQVEGKEALVCAGYTHVRQDSQTLMTEAKLICLPHVLVFLCIFTKFSAAAEKVDL